MRIEIDICTAMNPKSHRCLDRILRKINDGWHVWDTSKLTDPLGEFGSTQWLRDPGRAGDDVRELLTKSVERSAWEGFKPHGRYVRVTESPSSTDELRPEDAASLAEEQLCILVENRFNDRKFVECIVYALDKPLSSLLQKCTKPPIKFDSSGGHTEMKKVVQCKTRGFAL